MTKFEHCLICLRKLAEIERDLGGEADKVHWSFLPPLCADEDIDAVGRSEAGTYKHGLH